MPTINASYRLSSFELTVGEAFNQASDIYSLGVLIHWLFTMKNHLTHPMS
jgi:hypothetical protein